MSTFITYGRDTSTRLMRYKRYMSKRERVFFNERDMTALRARRERKTHSRRAHRDPITLRVRYERHRSAIVVVLQYERDMNALMLITRSEAQ